MWDCQVSSKIITLTRKNTCCHVMLKVSLFYHPHSFFTLFKTTPVLLYYNCFIFKRETLLLIQQWFSKNCTEELIYFMMYMYLIILVQWAFLYRWTVPQTSFLTVFILFCIIGATDKRKTNKNILLNQLLLYWIFYSFRIKGNKTVSFLKLSNSPSQKK